MKKKKTILMVLFVLFMCAALGFAGGKQEEKDGGASAAASGDQPLKIFFTNAWLPAPYCAPMTEAVEAFAAENNIEIQIVDGEGDSQKQLDQIKNAVTKGFDGIIYFPADAASTIPVVKYLDKSDIPFVVLNSNVDPSVQNLSDAYVGMDYEYSGGVGGQICADTLGAKGGNIVVIEGAGGTEAQLGYQAGFEQKALVNDNIKIIAKQQADWDPANAMKITEDYLTTFGDDIDFIYSHDDGMCAGIAQALEDAGLLGKIPLVCNGQSQFVLDAIAAGEILGSASQDPRIEGVTGLKVLLKLINGEKVDAWTKIECVPITKENAGKFKGW